MPQLTSPIVFDYIPDEDKTFEENIKDVMEHITQVTQNGQIAFTLRVELPTQTVDAKEHVQLLNGAIADAIAMSETEMVPASVDADGEMLHKRKKAE